MIQRYRINNCADIADDNGGYCLNEDVAELEKSKWIGVNDEYPEVKTQYLVWVSGEGFVAVAYVEKWSDGEEQWVFCLSQLDGLENQITHWQPLPPPPTMTDKGEE